VDSDTGLVGPLSVNSNTRQNILLFTDETDKKTLYSNPKEMIIFSNKHARNSLGGQIKGVPLVGLCLMIRKEVWQKIGGMDPIYGFGNFEDKDYDIRNRRIGYQSVICNDVFIDHVGSSTFSKSNLPYIELMFQNFTYSCYKHNVPLNENHNFDNLAETISNGKLLWFNQRFYFEEQDKIPFHIHECLENFEALKHPFPKENTLVAYPSIFDKNWLSLLEKSLEQGWNIILRPEPPFPDLEKDFAQMVGTLPKKLQAKVFIDGKYLPTIHRGAIYERVSGVLELPRFDWFRFEREAQAINIPVIKL
jgi:hypothetical protein